MQADSKRLEMKYRCILQSFELLDAIHLLFELLTIRCISRLDALLQNIIHYFTHDLT